MAVSTDTDIQRAVQEELRRNARLQPNQIEVAVKDGVVVLTGIADSYVKKLAAEEAALRVPGVKSVANDIQVLLPDKRGRTDADLAELAREALERDAEVPADRIKASVTNGVVYLEGEVENAYQKEAAKRAVSHLSGVKGVVNLIDVKTRAKATNLKRDVEQALMRNARTDPSHIQVDVQGCKVTLRDRVASYAEKEAAELTVWSLPGVEEVENLLIII